MAIFPSRVTPKQFMAFSSLSPPLLTYLNVLPLTSISASSLKVCPALSSLLLSTYTIPDIMIALAFSRDSASPFLTRSTSNLSFKVLSPFQHALSCHKQSPHLVYITYAVRLCFPALHSNHPRLPPQALSCNPSLLYIPLQQRHSHHV